MAKNDPRRVPRERPRNRLTAFVGENLRNRRKELGLSIREASELTRPTHYVNIKTWSDYERGLSDPSLLRFLAACLALGSSPGTILGESFWRELEGSTREARKLLEKRLPARADVATQGSGKGCQEQPELSRTTGSQGCTR